MNITATSSKTSLQGLTCYYPALRVSDGDYKNTFISRGDPLVTRADAIKYAHIWRNESIQAGYVTYF